jgi:hypothetical protein
MVSVVVPIMLSLSGDVGKLSHALLYGYQLLEIIMTYFKC